MTLGADPTPTQVSGATTVAEDKGARRLQFSLSALMLLMLLIAAGCAAVRWLGSVWIVPVVLAGVSAVNFAMALRAGTNLRMLKPSYWHLVIWLALGAAVSAISVNACLQYNDVAGTDKTPEHIIQISAVALAGPMVGPVANPGAGETPQAWRMTAILFTILFLTISPFLFVRRTVPLALAVVSWLAFVAASLMWFFGAIVSLGVFLS